MVMTCHHWLEGFIDCQHPVQRNQRQRLRDQAKPSIWVLAKRKSPPGLLEQVMLRMNEYMSGFQPRCMEGTVQVIRCTATVGPHPVMELMMMAMMMIFDSQSFFCFWIPNLFVAWCFFLNLDPYSCFQMNRGLIRGLWQDICNCRDNMITSVLSSIT